MSSKQAARERRASERAQRERCNRPASLCSYAGTAVAPASRKAGMRTSAIAACRRLMIGWSVVVGTEAAA